MTWVQHVSRIPAAREAAYEAALRALELAVEGVPALLYARREGGFIWHVVACDDATRAKLLAEVGAEDAEAVGAGLAEVELGEGLRPDQVAVWDQPGGAGDARIAMRGDARAAGGRTWESLIDWNVWRPDVAPLLWRLLVPPAVAEWAPGVTYTQPATVTGQGKTWALQTATETAAAGREPWQAYMWAVWQEV